MPSAATNAARRTSSRAARRPGPRRTGSRASRPRTRPARAGPGRPSRRTRTPRPARDPAVEHPEPGEVGGAVAVLDRAGDEEQQAGDQPVRDAGVDRRLHAADGERRRAEHHEAHVAHAGVGDQPLEVGLRETRQRGVHDADHGQRRDHRHQQPLRRGERHPEPDEAVGAELEQHRREHHRPDRGGLGVGVGQPDVQRPQRVFTARPSATSRLAVSASGPEASYDAAVATMSKVPVRVRATRKPTSISAEPVTVKTRNHGGPVPARLVVLVAPGVDHEPHRDQRDLEEDEEQHHVERQKLPSTPDSITSSSTASRPGRHPAGVPHQRHEAAGEDHGHQHQRRGDPVHPRRQPMPMLATQSTSTVLPGDRPPAYDDTAHTDHARVTSDPVTAAATAARSRAGRGGRAARRAQHGEQPVQGDGGPHATTPATTASAQAPTTTTIR